MDKPTLKQFGNDKSQKSPSIEKYSRLKKCYFNLLRLMLKEIRTNSFFEIMNHIIQTFQLLAFPFNPNVTTITLIMLVCLFVERKTMHVFSFFLSILATIPFY